MTNPATVNLQLPNGADDDPDPEPRCEDTPYQRHAPGIYEARCITTKVYRDPRFKRWVLRLEFQLWPPDGRHAFGFLNLGTRAKPSAGRGSEYRRAWIIASGDQPRKRQTMSSRVFKDKVFQVRIGDTATKHDGRKHLEVEIYSSVKEIITRVWP